MTDMRGSLALVGCYLGTLTPWWVVMGECIDKQGGNAIFIMGFERNFWKELVDKRGLVDA